MSEQAVNSSSTRLRRLQISRLQSEGVDSPEQQTPQASESHEPMPVIASRAEPGPRSNLCSNFTTKLLSLLMLSGTAEASSGSPKKEEENNELEVEKNKSITPFQASMRKKFPKIADFSDSLSHVDTNPVRGVGSLAKGSLKGVQALGEFLGEEAARVKLGENTKTGDAFVSVGTFIGEEAARLRLGEGTLTAAAAKRTKAFVGKEIERFDAGEKTVTGQVATNLLEKVGITPIDQTLQSIGSVSAQGLGCGYVFKKTAQGLHWTWKEASVQHGLRTFNKRVDVTHTFSKVRDKRAPKGRARNNFNSLEQAAGSKRIHPDLARNANAQINLNKKMRALQKAQKKAVRTETLSDGRVRYHMPERISNTDGPTRGASYVVEHNPTTGQVRSWNECYDHQGNVNRIHPKTIDGQNLDAQHYPPTKSELTGRLTP